MTPHVLLKSVTVIDGLSPFHLKEADILIKEGLIVSVGEPASGEDLPSDVQVVDKKGCYVSAGWMDMQANFCDPGDEHKEDIASGSRAAAAGGFTDVVLTPNTQPVIQTKNDIRYLQSAAGRLVQLHPLAAVSRHTSGEELTEMIDLHHAGAVAFSDGSQPLWHPQVMLKALQYVQKFDGLLITRPEDTHLNMYGAMHEGIQSTMLGMKGMPVLAETIAIERDLSLLAYAVELSVERPPRLHFSNLSAAASVDLVRQAKARGLPVSCDVAAHQFYFDDTMLADFDTNYKVNPPLRTRQDINALLEGLADGTIDVIVSAHQPQDEESKKCEFDQAAFGIAGLQTVFPILNSLVSSSLPLPVLIDKITTAPRKLLKLAVPQVQEGAVACLTLFSTEQVWTLDPSTYFSKSKNNPLFGSELKGKALGIWHDRQAWMDIR